jgi:hypothetical protein
MLAAATPAEAFATAPVATSATGTRAMTTQIRTSPRIPATRLRTAAPPALVTVVYPR